ncbi:MAG: 50S ribosomal protein L9 [Clostridia bacterium]|nr:50S ribosomal protein L9 [Clostridia bacterium]
MKVILTADVKAQGKKGDVINVSDGYATNFLFKNNLAVPANAGNVSVNNARKKAEAERIAAETAAAKELAKKISNIELEMNLEIGANGKAFGSITGKEISDELAKRGIEVDRKKIEINTIKTVGTFVAELKLYKGVSAKLKVNVTERKNG